MFSKLSASSLCVCNNSAVLTTTTRMIDTQINRETAITGCVVREKQDKMAPSTANNAREEVARVNILNMATRQDINCNTPAEKQQQQLNRVMSAPNGNCNSKRSPKSLGTKADPFLAHVTIKITYSMFQTFAKRKLWRFGIASQLKYP